MRYGSDKAYAQYGPVEYRKRPIAPLEEIEIDHTSGDLFCLDSISGAPLGRPTVALGTDRCTAMPWGVYVGFDPPSVHTVMQLLRNGLFPKTYVRAYADAGIWKIENSWPAFGRPVKLSVDRASENLGHDLRAFGVDLPIKEIEAKAGRTGRFKGQIERLLGTLNRNLLQQQRGTTFSNILERGDYDPRKNAVITYEELLEKIHAWLIDVYMRQPHNGIKDVPIRLWNEKIQLYRPHQIENVEGVLPLFGRIEHRVLRRDGIRWKNLFYTSPELMSLLANRKFRTAAADPCGNIVVRFRYDPSNISSIHVYLPHARGQSSMHLLVPVEKRAAEYARGLSVWAHDSIASIARAKLNASIDLASLDRAKSQLISDMESQTPASIKVRGALRIARMRQIGGLAPFGDQLRTTPDGSFEDARQISAVTCSDPLSDMRAGKGTKLDRYEVRDQSGEQSTSHSPLTVESGKGRKYRRGDDPQEISNSKPLSANRRDHTVPVIHIDQDDDEVDFYSEDIKP
jgi:putative transposase